MSITNKIKVGIVGGSGYTGGELIRLLINHPNVDISFINSKTYTGKKVVFQKFTLGRLLVIWSEIVDQPIDNTKLRLQATKSGP